MPHVRTVTHEGDRYLLVKRSGESSLVRDPETGDERYLPNDELVVTGESPLVTAARAVPADARDRLPVADEEALGLLAELHERGPVDARTLMDGYDRCESDFHGLVTELRAAGLVREARVAGERGYELTDLAADALE